MNLNLNLSPEMRQVVDELVVLLYIVSFCGLWCGCLLIALYFKVARLTESWRAFVNFITSYYKPDEDEKWDFPPKTNDD
jgi:hypothetical protein